MAHGDNYQPIVLWTPKASLTSDDACTTILQYKLPPSPATIRPPYQQPATDTDASPRLSYVPSLTYFCIRTLVEYPDQLHSLGPARLPYQEPTSPHDFDILQALIPTYRPFSPNRDQFDLRLIDPRLWAVLAQIYHGLPSVFRTYTLPLSDIHLPLLQAIPSTYHFSLITVLSLTRRSELTDDTVVQLRHLHTLAALDASVTALGSRGVQRLAKCLSWTEGDDDQLGRRGPWGLRVLYLRDCININDEVLPWLSRFPMLSVIDLRGTVCKPWRRQDLPFSSSSDVALFHPNTLSRVLAHLSSLTERPRTLFSHPAPYVLNVDSLQHTVDPTPAYRPSRSLWDITDRSMPEHGPQIGRGRMDVFLPYEPPHYASPSYEAKETTVDYGSGKPDELYADEDEESYRARVGRNDSSDSAESESVEDPYEAEGRMAIMNEVADDEMALYRRERAAERFYHIPSSRPPAASTPAGSGSNNRTEMPTATTRVADPLMLFRRPAPWNSLPASPPAAKSTARAAGSALDGAHGAPFTSTPSAKPGGGFATLSAHARRLHIASSNLKGKAPDDAHGSTDPHKRMHALTSIQSMFDMVQKRTVQVPSKPSHNAPPQPQPAPTRPNANPFVRAGGTPRGSKLETMAEKERAKATPTIAAPTAKGEATEGLRANRPSLRLSSSMRVETEQATSDSSDSSRMTKAGASTPMKRPSSPLPRVEPPRVEGGTQGVKPDAEASPRPAKKLKPITTLTVPDWPTHVKPLSAHKLNPRLSSWPAAGATAKVKAEKQTTLPVVQKPPNNSSSAKDAGRRLSASVVASNGPGSDQKQEVKEEKGAVGKPLKTSGKQKVVRKSPGGFDWKGWSAG